MTWKKVNINTAADYICIKAIRSGENISVLKLQKLLYYVQAWHLAFYKETLFEGERFQAWVHGPVNRTIFDRFRGKKLMYSPIYEADLDVASLKNLDPRVTTHIDSVLEVYMPFTGTQLEDLTHSEEPWISARGGAQPTESSDREIDEKLMISFYSSIVSA